MEVESLVDVKVSVVVEEIVLVELVGENGVVVEPSVVVKVSVVVKDIVEVEKVVLDSSFEVALSTAIGVVITIVSKNSPPKIVPPSKYFFLTLKEELPGEGNRTLP